ncbi:MAG TPA: RDD family protein [Syntrophales bacterium]|nr:RDD family protein [Syntrophales bacterium]
MADNRFGGFWRRAMAFSIDKIILFFISLFILFAGALALSMGFLSHYRDLLPERVAQVTVAFMFFYLLMTAFIGMLYFTYFHGASGQTPGKMIFGLKVIQSTGEEMTFGLAFLRWVGYIISCLCFYIGFLWIAFDGKKQGWHDKIAGTLVVRVRNIVDGPAFAPEEKALDKECEIL